MEKAHSVVCVCDTQEQARRAGKNLQAAGIDMQTLSLATRNVSTDERGLDKYHVGDQAFLVPGIGPLLVNGPLASWMLPAWKDGAGGESVGVLAAGLATIGISPNSILEYEAALRIDRYLLVLHGSAEAVAQAVRVIGGTTHCSHTIHGETVFDTVHGAALPAMSTLMSPA